MKTLRPVQPGLADPIVHWEFSTQEWQQFLEFDKQKRHKQDFRHVLAIFVLLALVLVVVLFLGAVEAFVALVIFAGIIALGVLVHLLMQRQRYQKMESPAPGGGGDVYITPNGVWTNGVWFDWGDATPWHLSTVTPVLSDTGVRLPPGALSYIEFNCSGRAAGRHRAHVDKKWRVPVPRGKEDEARGVASYFGKPTADRDEFGLPYD